MIKFIIRRLLYMIPIVLGVIMLNFVLFNIAGGSAASMHMGEGKNASPLDLENYDEVRGYNKPLFFGNWAKTRALEDNDFEMNAGAWSSLVGIEYDDSTKSINITTDKLTLPLAFDLNPKTTYKVEIRCTFPGDTKPTFVVNQGSESLPDSITEPVYVAEWTTLSDTANASYVIENSAGMTISSITFRRGMESPFDSQFLFYLGQLVRLDFGYSEFAKQDVIDMLADRIVPTLCLTIPILTCGILLAISLSLLCAFCDRLCRSFTLMLG